MAWSPLLQHHPAHRWLRQLIMHVARQVIAEEEAIMRYEKATIEGEFLLPPLDLDDLDPDRQ